MPTNRPSRSEPIVYHLPLAIADLIDDYGTPGVEVVAEIRIATPVARFRVADHDIAVVGISRRRTSGLMAPESATLMTIPVVVNPRPDHERH